MRYLVRFSAVVFISILFLQGCSSTPSSPLKETDTTEEDDRIFIVDRTGKKWDVTHARAEYGMLPSNFQFGLGPFAITPILNPIMLSAGDSGYPANNETFLVLGTTINDDTRTYPITVMSWVEVVDEKFGNLNVAVAY